MARTYQDVCDKVIRDCDDFPIKENIAELRKRTKRDLLMLKRKGINSFESLREALLQPTPSIPLYTAIRLMERFEKSRAVPVFLRMLNSDNPSQFWGQLDNTLATMSGKLVVKGCLKILSRPTDDDLRETVVYIISVMWGQREAIDVLLEIFTNEQETLRSRAQAAEGLGSLLDHCYTRRHRIWREVGDALIEGLSHEAPEIRFSSAFGLNQMRYKKALPKLEELAEFDKTLRPGAWTVGEMAYDAAFYIRTGQSSGIDRIPVPITQN